MKLLLPILAALLLAAAAGAQEEAAPETDEQIVERILALGRQIDELMELLSPEIREEVRRRLAEPPTEAEPKAEPTPAPAVTTPPPPLPRRIRRRRECNTLVPLDENADGKINAADRHWRHLFLWTDRNGDGQMQDREIESAYDRRVRELAVSLETFLHNKGSLGEVRVEDHIVLDLRGDGFADRSRRDDGVLVVDATALARGQGPEIQGPAGETLDGYQAFRSGLRIQDTSGKVTEIDCP
ncbi:MAG: hypothetical protein GY719_08845 [bacterium]|nr:hypothetical protein [bacterium]